MDKSALGSSLLTSIGRRTPNRRSSSIGGNSSRRISTKPARGVHSQVIYRSQLNIVESFGSSLPVLVREALTFPEKSSDVSVRLSNEGWAWFVCGRRLLVWQCDIGGDGVGRRPLSNHCRELTLPSSAFAYTADLVIISTSPANSVPSCIAASPEGIVRYWPSIAHEGSSVEVNAELQGQECDSLTDISPVGCILATTTASVVLLTPHSVGGRPSIAVKPLKAPQGWLGGITRLIPSIIFGSLQSTHGMETKLVKIAATRKGSAWLLHVLAGHTLQQWLLATGEIEQLVYECDISKLADDAYHTTLFEPMGGSIGDIETWLLDLQPTENGVCVLLGGTNQQLSPQFFYALGTLLPNTSAQPEKFHSFYPVKPSLAYRESDESELLSCRALLYGSSALLYTRRKVMVTSAVNFGEDADTLDLVGPTDEILAASLCGGIPALFTKEHALISVTPIGTSRADISVVSDIATSSASLQSEPLALVLAVSDAELEDLENSSNPVSILEAAFIRFLRRNNDAAEKLVNSIFPRDEESANDGLDNVVVAASQDLVDAVPAGDPRWVNERSGPALGSASLQIAHQLEDKLRASDAFIGFLKWSKLWEKLQIIEIDDAPVPTKQVLAEHREKLVGMSALKELHNSYGAIMDQCVQHVIRDETPPGLTPQDLFYRHVTNIHSALQMLVHLSEAAVNSDRRTQDIALALTNANNVLLKCLDAVLEWRKQHLTAFVPNASLQEYLPWTASTGLNGLRDSLNLQHALTLKYGARATGEHGLRSKLYEQLMKISDVLLDGWRAHVRSIMGSPKFDTLSQQYEAHRLSLIKPFLEDGEYERAAVLGEKYLDFNVLVQVCELTDNVDRLDSYCNKYSEENFSQYLFSWYVREGKPGRLLERFRSRGKPSSQQQLSQFLTDHPSLSWLQNIFCQDFVQASSTLEVMAQEEKDLLQRKKTMLSLSKLSLLASNEPDDVAEDKLNELDVALQLIDAQEELPTSVLSAQGYDLPKLRVFSLPEIIKLYISDQNEEANESDFKKALDLLDHVSDELEKNQLRQAIWCNAILRDAWTDIDPNSQIEDAINNLFFFRLVDLLECFGCPLEESLPPVSTLMEFEELGDLRYDRHFQYLIRLGYEHFMKTASN